jgi:hypothetical protein
MIAQEQHGVHGAPNQASLFEHSLNLMSANASHQLHPADAHERSRRCATAFLDGIYRMGAQNTDRLSVSVLTAHAVRARASEGFEQAGLSLLSYKENAE